MNAVSVNWMLCFVFVYYHHVLFSPSLLKLCLRDFLLLCVYYIGSITMFVHFFCLFERLFKKNKFGIIPKGIVPAWRPRVNQTNFWYSVLIWTVFQWTCFASTRINGCQKGKGLGYEAGEVKLPTHCFPNSISPVLHGKAEHWHDGKSLPRV